MRHIYDSLYSYDDYARFNTALILISRFYRGFNKYRENLKFTYAKDLSHRFIYLYE